MIGQFSYRTTRDGKVLIDWQGRTVTTLAGEDARKFMSRVHSVDAEGEQQLLARATGNFKRGNER
ncbi:MAG: hypothetical protein ABR583_07515 [Gaiellaceae bacterium]